jgi:hypothetical protein
MKDIYKELMSQQPGRLPGHDKESGMQQAYNVTLLILIAVILFIIFMM